MNLPRLHDDFLLYLQSKEGLEEAMQDTPEDFQLWVKRSTDRLKRLALEKQVLQLANGIPKGMVFVREGGTLTGCEVHGCRVVVIKDTGADVSGNRWGRNSELIEGVRVHIEAAKSKDGAESEPVPPTEQQA